MGFISRFAAMVMILAGVILYAPDSAQSAERPPVGRLATPKGPLCTGVLVGDYAVLTAAHCVTTREGTGYFAPELIHFSLSDQGDRYGEYGLAYAKGVELHVNPAYPLPVSVKPEALAEDWAVLLIDKPLGREIGMAQIVPQSRLGNLKDYALTITAFGRARTSRPTLVLGPCGILNRDRRLITHDCLVERGSSGSLLLGKKGGRLYALGVNVARRWGKDASTTTALLPERARRLAGTEPETATPFESPFKRSGKASWSQ